MSVNISRHLFQLIDDHPRLPKDCHTCSLPNGRNLDHNSASWPEPELEWSLELYQPECEEDFRETAYNDLCMWNIQDRYAQMGMDPDEAPIINHELINY